MFAKSHKSANETYETNLKKQNKKQLVLMSTRDNNHAAVMWTTPFLFILLFKFEFRVQRAFT